MQATGTLIHCDEALRYIEDIENPVTRNLVNMVFVRLVQRRHLERHELPACDLDMLYLVTALKDFFSEPDIVARALSGEKVGAMFGD